MKRYRFKYTQILVAIFLIGFGISSCVKERNGLTTLTTVASPGEIAEISQPGFRALAFELSTTPQLVKAYVNVAAPTPVKEDVTVTLALDPKGLELYDTANHASFIMLDPAAYSIPDFKVVIKKGENLGFLPITIRPDKVDLSKANAIALKITDASGRAISQNFQSVIYAILVKNKYDGEYHAKGYFSHPTAPRDIDRDKHMATVNANTVETELGDLGNWLMQLTVNANNTISFKPTGASNTTAALLNDDPVYNNTYDPATKTFKLKYGYPNPGPTRIITEFIKAE